jgi:hypothetical protein
MVSPLQALFFRGAFASLWSEGLPGVFRIVAILIEEVAEFFVNTMQLSPQGRPTSADGRDPSLHRLDTPLETDQPGTCLTRLLQVTVVVRIDTTVARIVVVREAEETRYVHGLPFVVEGIPRGAMTGRIISRPHGIGRWERNTGRTLAGPCGPSASIRGMIPAGGSGLGRSPRDPVKDDLELAGVLAPPGEVLRAGRVDPAEGARHAGRAESFDSSDDPSVVVAEGPDVGSPAC